MPYNPYDQDNDNFFTPIIHPVAAAVIGLFVVFFTYQIIGGLVTIAVFGLDIESANVNAFRFMTMLGQFMFILAPTLLLSYMFYQNIPDIIRLKKPGLVETLVFIGGLAILMPLIQELVPVQNYIINSLAESSGIIKQFKSFFDELTKSLDGTYMRLLKSANIFELSWVVFVIALTPAICEEVLFRGFIQRSLEFKISPFISAVITGVVFGLYHFNPYGLLSLILIGFYLGFAAYKSNSIIIPMIIHFLNNFITVIAYYIWGDTELMETGAVPEGDITTSLIKVVIFTGIFIGFIIVINRNYHKLKGGNNDLS